MGGEGEFGGLGGWGESKTKLSALQLQGKILGNEQCYKEARHQRVVLHHPHQ
jgi:hypothetical protein